MGGFAAFVPVISAIGSVLGGVAALKSMSGGKQQEAPAPAVSKVTPMPEPDDAAARMARRRSAASQSERKGRQSTILSDDLAGDLLGG